ncbi:unnamed protein product [Ceutorhynchus assimilis]|uniref:HMG box domain-containing protein n=1 Tax=Ceutorhynchus assimilis TaxID=467358 RepID=A0A9N9MYB0_9CUCU|nr:unnamed protein product [Ceutorhynchus assimilis]
MARQSFFFKACSLFNGNSKLAFHNGFPQASFLVPCMGLKTKAPNESLKIPEKPKKPLTSYFRFLIEKRPIVTKENPSLDNKGIVKTIGEHWKSLAPEQKAKYEIEFSIDKEQYDKELLSYNNKLTPELEAIINQIKADKKTQKKETQN